MNDDQKTTAVLAGLSVKFTCLALAFWAASHAVTVGERKPLAPGAVFTNTATVRLSVAELTKSGGDVSGLDCYACHKREQPVAPKFDTAGQLIPSVAHRDVVFSRMNCAPATRPRRRSS